MQVRDRGGRALVVLRVVREVEEADALVEGLLVEPFDARHTDGALRGVDEVAGDGVPVLLVDRHDVVAQLVEVRRHGGGVPPLGAGGRPLVPVGRQRLEGDEGVVRGAAAQDAGAAVPDVGVAAWLLGGGVVVVELTAQQAHPAAQREDFGAVDVGGTALDDGDADGRVLGEPGRDHRTCGSAADDDVVVYGHGLLLLFVRGRHKSAVDVGAWRCARGLRNRSKIDRARSGRGR